MQGCSRICEIGKRKIYAGSEKTLPTLNKEKEPRMCVIGTWISYWPVASSKVCTRYFTFILWKHIQDLYLIQSYVMWSATSTDFSLSINSKLPVCQQCFHFWMNSTELSLDETHFNSIPVSIHYAEQGLAKTVYTHRVYTIYIHHIYIIYMVLTNPTLNTIKYPCCITELYQVHTQVHYWTVSGAQRRERRHQHKTRRYEHLAWAHATGEHLRSQVSICAHAQVSICAHILMGLELEWA